ncbi:MAG TPA: hypothetical protein VGN35_10810 [Jatrophihabitantaceae bacterium]|nr:hypothetical protein [Jatrophihabitantaceae bacterium]
MTATSQARPKLWPLVVAVAACLFFALMFLVGGKTAAHSATPRANAPFALATDVTNTIFVTQVVTNTVDVTDVHTSYVPFTITQTNTANVTATAHKTQTNVQNLTRVRTQVNHVNTTAVFNVNQTNQVNATILATKQITKPVNVTNSVIVTNTANETSTQNVVQTVEVAASKSKPLADRARLAIGAGGVAVTSAAGFGFLMLRRRGRYTS